MTVIFDIVAVNLNHHGDLGWFFVSYSCMNYIDIIVGNVVKITVSDGTAKVNYAR